MKSPFLVVGTLFLLSITGGECSSSFVFFFQQNYNFGDIIAFPKVMGCKCMPLATYKHYAVYVGKEEFEGKKPDEDIFHLTGPVQSMKVADCVFGKLSTQGEHELDNYLDTIWTIDPVHIKQRIKELHKNCPAEKSKEFRIGSWKPFSHNCEHIANYVRYGNEVSLQRGQSGENNVKNPNISEEMLKEIKEKLCAKSCEEVCPLDAPNAG
ncbi:PREDICTED: uncharacterized protein LOC107080996 [Cyprinodon variegatus]|uniref:uncharacterized protein LOC107080996 n=1 Tax=Cyprinodon variegatus TaxID=28743 RepID=UPI000742881B|nr:PREDICTED: uncharacterized protein LOC107080996 [Cyprinodon variegatus]